ncbi:hypothetical protein, conserved [Trypanosoma cruzi]|uniref:Uncharacterized protein n=1 Tax=Trypanosoma cruzi (strain CL Brener) TaxID=353153 RepID=Q4DTX4_TRYCC|nr:hypothetical protein, conserved [Trypanosoma cruzi]EAN95986.1 hypothetical protein, conserved [Trypanosoma cruzi]|eukprot:XP_817837.1 hypothetical protein [Trypanosoma cruzi strain CL Brener]
MSQTRTFVFITNIPDFLLEPLSTASTSATIRRRENRDPLYERLRALLAANTSGVMLVMHLQTRGYALALYASEKEALEACKTNIVPEQPGHKYSPLLLRILRRERPAPSEAVYTPTLTVEGEVVQKAELADTRGLELVYRGRAVAKWCPHTLAREDCLFGTACYRLHKRAYQKTVLKRPRLGEAVVHHMTPEERALVHRISCNTRRAEECVIPAEMRIDFSLHVSLTRDEAEALVDDAAGVVPASVLQRVEAACAGHGGPYFVKFDFPGGAPWDWSLHDDREGLPRLRQRLPFPENGAPTPLERDIFCQQLLYHLNQMNRFETISSALRALAHSPKVQEALRRVAQNPRVHEGKPEEGEGGAVALGLCIRPWLFLPTVGVEVSVLLESGGDRVRGIVQRRSALRLMTCFSFLQKHGMNLSRYAVIGSGQDVYAEESLEAEMRRVEKAVKRAVEGLRQHLRQQVSRGGQLPSNAAWCFQLAVMPSTSPSSVAAGEDAAEMRCVVLSMKPYEEAFEEFTAMHPSLMRDEAVTDVIWNTKRHTYVALFPRELMERLKED